MDKWRFVLFPIAIAIFVSNCSGGEPPVSMSSEVSTAIAPSETITATAEEVAVAITASAIPTTLHHSVGEVIRVDIGDINAGPARYKGQKIEISGDFMGWDLFDDVGEGPPVTRSDWVIKDSTGAIYVTGGIPATTEGVYLDPGSREDTGRKVMVEGFVEATSSGQPYIRAERIRVGE